MFLTKLGFIDKKHWMCTETVFVQKFSSVFSNDVYNCTSFLLSFSWLHAKNKNVTESAETEGSEEQAKLVTADYLGLHDEWELVDMVAPVCLREEQETHERELYFYPSIIPGEPFLMME